MKLSSTWIYTSLGYLLGFGVAELTDVRMYGGPFLALGGIIAGLIWWKRNGFTKAIVAGLLYLALFGFSHSLTHYLGAWPSVFTITAIMGIRAYLLDREANNPPVKDNATANPPAEEH